MYSVSGQKIEKKQLLWWSLYIFKEQTGSCNDMTADIGLIIFAAIDST